MWQKATFYIFEKVLFDALYSSTNLAINFNQIPTGLYLWKDFMFLFLNKKIFEVSMYSFNEKQKKIFQTTPHKISCDFIL